MLRIQRIQDAREMIVQDKHGLKNFATDPHLDLKDKVVVVLGNSPALKKVNLSLLDKFMTIGVNRIGRVYTPTALLFTDPPILAAEEPFYRAFKGPIFVWHNYAKSWVHELPNARYFLLGPPSRPSGWVWPETLKDPLIRQGTTTAYCLQLAVLGGARVVGMLGVDFSAVQQSLRGETDTHFYGNGPALQSTGGGDWHDIHAEFYTKFPAWAASKGTTAINLTPFPDTPINRAGWPKLSLEEFHTQYSK